MIDNEGIGKRIRKLRTSEHLTIQEMAETIGCDYDHLQKAEKGKRSLSLDIIDIICQRFDVTADEILYGEKPPDPRFSYILKDIETCYEASKRLYNSAKYAEQSGIPCRNNSQSTAVSFNQRLTEEERILWNRKKDDCGDL